MNATLRYQIDLIFTLTQKDLAVRYSNSYLGYLWSLANPLAYAMTFFLVFKVFIRIDMENYAMFLIAGLFSWQWFSNSITMAPTIFIANDSMVKKVNFPRSTLPFSTTLQDMIHFILSIIVIVAFLLYYDMKPALSWIYGVPLLLVLQFFMVFGLSLLLSSFNVFFRDIERLTNILVMLLFYSTPIIYSETMIPDRFKLLLYLNPITPIIISWRKLFMEGTLDPLFLMLSAAYASGAFIIGYIIFKKLSWKFAEAL
ncbi:MAG: ABC transporter permease [Deltaproteobacteria bacterium]|nr:ABC transporter permease [Deltaproteobacteria bacterium]